jgi:hypothetical protein
MKLTLPPPEQKPHDKARERSITFFMAIALAALVGFGAHALSHTSGAASARPDRRHVPNQRSLVLRVAQQPPGSAATQSVAIRSTLDGYLNAAANGERRTVCNLSSRAMLDTYGTSGSSLGTHYQACLQADTNGVSWMPPPAEISAPHTIIHGNTAIFSATLPLNLLEVALYFESGTWRMGGLTAPKHLLPKVSCGNDAGNSDDGAVGIEVQNGNCAQARTAAECATSRQNVCADDSSDEPSTDGAGWYFLDTGNSYTGTNPTYLGGSLGIDAAEEYAGVLYNRYGNPAAFMWFWTNSTNSGVSGITDQGNFQ